jgi:hypothetical protein
MPRHHRSTRWRLGPSSRGIPRRTTGRPPPRGARPIISMLSRCEPPTTCSGAVSPGQLTRIHTVLSQPCNANPSPPRTCPDSGATHTGRTARRIRRPRGRCSNRQRALIRNVRYSAPAGDDIVAVTGSPAEIISAMATERSSVGPALTIIRLGITPPIRPRRERHRCTASARACPRCV